MPACKVYYVDKDKFLSLVNNNKQTKLFTLEQLSILIGYRDPDTLKAALRNGYFSARMINGLKSEFNINYNDYKANAEQAQDMVDMAANNVELEQQYSQDEFLEKLAKIIYDSTFRAVSDALKG